MTSDSGKNGRNNLSRASNRNDGFFEEQTKPNKFNGNSISYTDDLRRYRINDRNVRSSVNQRHVNKTGNRSGINRGHKSEKNTAVKSEKVSIKLDDPRYTAKYWTSTGASGSDKTEKNNSKTVNLCC